MNKPPQPLAGPPSVPHPAPSPGLTQAAYPPGQPPSVVFGPPPQMNSAPQPRQFAPGPRALHQQQYYHNRPNLPSSAPRVPPSSTPRPVPPAHVYPASSQMMMIQQQPLQFANSQGTAYFLPPGQYRPPYVPPAQQYPVASAPAGFYSGTNPDYEASLAARERRGGGGRGTGRENGRISLHAAPLTSQRYPGESGTQGCLCWFFFFFLVFLFFFFFLPFKKSIRIRDPNQGGRDITEEIMSGGRTTSTPTPPQLIANGIFVPCWNPVFKSHLFCVPDDRVKPAAPSAAASTPPPPSKTPEPAAVAAPLAAEPKAAPDLQPAPSVSDASVPPLHNVSPDVSASPSPPPAVTSLPPADSPAPPTSETCDTVDAPVPPEAASQKQEEPTEPEPPVALVEQPCDIVEKVEPEVPMEKEPEPLPEKAQPVSDSAPAPSAASTTPPEDAAAPTTNGSDEPEEKEPAPEPVTAQVQPSEPPAPTAEESEETWEEKEDKLDMENVEPEATKTVEQKYQYKEEHWKPINPEEKKRYDREFLLRFQFISASMHKPEGLPHITEVVLDKANKTPLRPLDPSRLMNCGPDFTPSFANLGRQPPGGGRGLSQRKEPRKIIATVSLSDDIQLNKAEKAWKPSVKKSRGRGAEEEEDLEAIKTQELFRRVRSVLNKLTPQMFQQLMKQVTELTIDTEERLKGVIDLVFEKAISEPNFSVAYANMCRCLMGLKVPTTDKPGVTVNFRKLLLNRCQKEFEKDKDDDEIFEQKQKELDAAKEDEERQRLKEELEDAKDKARRRSLGNIKFIGELFKLKMLTEPIMHDCIVKLLKNHDEESLECLCRLLSTIGKDLDFEKAKPRMDQYFNQMEKIIKERKTSSRIRFMLQDVLDLRRNNWVPRRGDQGPKTIDQIHKEAELEEHREQIKVQQQLLSKKDSAQGRGVRGPHSSGGGRNSQPQDEGWNTVPISTKSRPIDTSRLSKITKPGALDFNNQLLAPGGKGSWGSWGKGSSGGSGAKPSAEQGTDSGRPATSTLNRFSALQQPAPSSTSSSSSVDADRRVPHSRDRSDRDRSDRDRGDRFDRFERRDSREDRDRALDRNRPPVTKRSFSRENEERTRGGEGRGPADPVRRVASMTDDRGSRDRARSKETVKREAAPTPPPAPAKPALSEEEVEKKATAIIEEYLHINDLKEAVQCVQELNSASLLYLFVRSGVESTLERSTIAREHMGLLLQKLLSAGILSTEQYYKGLQEILEVADDMAIDIPHIWLYLAEIITPMLQEGGIPMGQLFREVSKPLLPLGKAATLLVQILSLLCKGLSHKKAGALWNEARLNWKDFLPEDEDVNKFVTEQKMEFTLGEESEKPSKKQLTAEELSKSLDRLIHDKANNQRVHDWVEANLDEQQVASNQFVRVLMTSVCQSAISESPYRVDVEQISQRAKLLQKYLLDEQKELQALYALQALMVRLEQPANLLRMLFDALYDEDVIKEEAFYKWESSKDPAEQVGKGVALKSVTGFFNWLREAEEESDNS
uniref:Eukaryotic translation initiation factor 4 gamma, 1a n=1 Tax=Pygocentrus nattereri TaxID=42514 RepID=A0AAR2LZF3_PYGNA